MNPSAPGKDLQVVTDMNMDGLPSTSVLSQALLLRLVKGENHRQMVWGSVNSRPYPERLVSVEKIPPSDLPVDILSKTALSASPIRPSATLLHTLQESQDDVKQTPGEAPVPPRSNQFVLRNETGL